LSSPLLKRIPAQVLSSFAKTWAGQLKEAVELGSVQSWWKFFAFPRLVLLTQARGGKKVLRGLSLAGLIRQRIGNWDTFECRQEMLQKARERSSFLRAKERANHGRPKEAVAQPKNIEAPAKAIGSGVAGR